MRFARITDGRVAEIIAVEEGQDIGDIFHADIVATCAPCGADVSYGWTYDGEDFSSPPPAAEVTPPVKRQFTFLEFMELFTTEEQLTLVEAAMTLPAIKLWYDKALGASYIDLDDPRTEPGLQTLVDENLISAERKVAVMAGQGPE